MDQDLAHLADLGFDLLGDSLPDPMGLINRQAGTYMNVEIDEGRPASPREDLLLLGQLQRIPRTTWRPDRVHELLVAVSQDGVAQLEEAGPETMSITDP